jgi:hypothetical protein
MAGKQAGSSSPEGMRGQQLFIGVASTEGEGPGRGGRSSVAGEAWGRSDGPGRVLNNVSVLESRKQRHARIVTPAHRRLLRLLGNDATKSTATALSPQPPSHPLHLAHASPSTLTLSVCDTCYLTNGPRLNARFCWPTRPFFDGIYAPFNCSCTEPTACKSEPSILAASAITGETFSINRAKQTQTWRPRESMRRWSQRMSSP